MNLNIQDQILNVLKKNDVTLQQLRDFAEFQVKHFLAKLFLKSGDPNNVYVNEIGKPVYDFYLNPNNGYKLSNLESAIQNKYVVVHEGKGIYSSSNENYFFNSWNDLKEYKNWLDSFEDGSFIPVFLIENGKTRFDVTFEVKHKIKSSLEM